jgi:hypothetical protein
MIEDTLLPDNFIKPNSKFLNNIIISLNRQNVRKPFPPDKLQIITQNFNTTIYNTYSQKVRNIVFEQKNKMCYKLNDVAVAGALTSGQILIMSVTDYEGKVYLTGFAVLFFSNDGQNIILDYLCTDTRLKNIGRNLILFVKKMSLIFFNMGIILNSTKSKYTQQFYLNQYFIRDKEASGDKLILYHWNYNNDNLEELHDLESFMLPFIASPTVNKTDKYKNEELVELKEPHIFHKLIKESPVTKKDKGGAIKRRKSKRTRRKKSFKRRK